MMLPLAVLMLGAIFAGGLNWPGASLGRFLGTSPSLAGTYQVAKLRVDDVPAAPLGQIIPGEEAEPAFSPVMAVSGTIAPTRGARALS